jgi:hypothetical protein
MIPATSSDPTPLMRIPMTSGLSGQRPGQTGERRWVKATTPSAESAEERACSRAVAVCAQTARSASA